MLLQPTRPRRYLRYVGTQVLRSDVVAQRWSASVHTQVEWHRHGQAICSYASTIVSGDMLVSVLDLARRANTLIPGGLQAFSRMQAVPFARNRFQLALAITSAALSGVGVAEGELSRGFGSACTCAYAH